MCNVCINFKQQKKKNLPIFFFYLFFFVVLVVFQDILYQISWSLPFYPKRKKKNSRQASKINIEIIFNIYNRIGRKKLFKTIPRLYWIEEGSINVPFHFL